MNRTPVSSSNLSSVGYDADTQTLEIEFNDGSVYQYSNVPTNIYEGLISAPSHGKYFHRNIRDSFNYTQIR
ncbi:KTSC domain-containing protein [Halorarius litoreus]|uniref:KTSC domain-containing protein n=1 Tax=Halorarius litoreus TaxID=2962676 RepID=UPI0020CC3B48|nr:KTSC domain-containing protein [Halorarius litoreus]